VFLLIYKGYSNPITGLEKPLGLQEVEAPTFLDNRYMKVVKFSAYAPAAFTPPPPPPGNIPGTHFC
jgi:hypothetical protein